MNKLKTWLWEIFLPAWAKNSVYRENEALKKKVLMLEDEIKCLNAYIDGIETGLKSQRRILIKNEVGK